MQASLSQGSPADTPLSVKRLLVAANPGKAGWRWDTPVYLYARPRMFDSYATVGCDEIRDRLSLQPPIFEYDFELRPGSKASMLIAAFEWRLAWFGLVPHVMVDGREIRSAYNVRSEALGFRFRGPWRRQQLALVPMKAFYGFNYESGKRVRWRIERQDGGPLTVAALWDARWRPEDGETLHAFSLLTIKAAGHPLMDRFRSLGIETRSLVVVPPVRRAEWLWTEHPTDYLTALESNEFTASPESESTARMRGLIAHLVRIGRNESFFELQHIGERFPGLDAVMSSGSTFRSGIPSQTRSA